MLNNQANPALPHNIVGGNVDLEYFMRLHEYTPPKSPDHSAAKWDRRAEAWAKEYSDPQSTKSDDRVQVTVDYLAGRGLLGCDSDIVDIGCGPGRFAVAFAQSARHVMGLDISPKMIEQADSYAQREGLSNVSFRVCDFQALDIRQEQLEGRFDLVFSSITPAIHGMNGLLKSMRMSRKYCCDVTHIYSENELESRIMREVFGRERPMLWANHWYYSLFNLLFLMGYYPEATHYKRHQENRTQVGKNRVSLFLEHMLAPHERTQENEALVYDWMKAHADENGFIAEKKDTWYGRILWDVRQKTARPVYWPVR